MISDTHVHTNRSSDCFVQPEEQIEKAISLGMKHICITDHNDFDAPTFPPDYYNFLLSGDGSDESFKEYCEMLHGLKEKYAEMIDVLTGIEFGLRPHIAQKLKKLAGSLPFDCIIGSTHSFDGCDAEDKSHYEGIPVQQAMTRYFEAEYENLTCFNDFDTVGHLDFAIRYAPGAAESFKYADYSEIIDAILEHIIKNDKALEINTSKYVLKNMTNPDMAIVKRYVELGGKLITFGSDSHTSSRIGEGFAPVGQMVKDAGISEYAVFFRHIPELFPIEA